MMTKFKFIDFHCHPNLKTFGHSFTSRVETPRSHLWYYDPPKLRTKILNVLTGLSKYSQSDFSSMSRGGVKIAFVSLYPFEKGFFVNKYLHDAIIERTANLVTGIGRERIRFLRTHKNYFEDLLNEYRFLMNGCKSLSIDNNLVSWQMAGSWQEVTQILDRENTIAVIPTIEGAHVLNTGLGSYGVQTDVDEVLHNLDEIKNWPYPPAFMTFSHNFNNDLCGHARSLEKLGSFVDQSENLEEGFSDLGLRVLRRMLGKVSGKPIYVDVKHMSLKGRLTYYELIENEFNGSIPIIVSHGAVAGSSLNSSSNLRKDNFFSNHDINFYDEELVKIAATSGIFALQMDVNRLVTRKNLKKSFSHTLSKTAHMHSAYIVWRQLQHIAEVLDRNGYDSWNITSIGSDFDGTINPLNGIWSSAYFPVLANALLSFANDYLKKPNSLVHQKNREISPEEIVYRFAYSNGINYLQKHYSKF